MSRAQKEVSRRRLLDAGLRVLGRVGYLATTVDDIAREAGVSRQTFYRHFDGKLDIAVTLFQERQEASQFWSGLDRASIRDPQAVSRWLESVLAFQMAESGFGRALLEVGTVEPSFMPLFNDFVRKVLAELGARTAAFADLSHPPADRRAVEAWLLIYQIFEQLSSLALGAAIIERRLLLDTIAHGFVAFVNRYDPQG